MDELHETLDKFLNPDSDIQVLSLKGDWGIGKTYFWEHFIKNKIDNDKLKFKAYSYISLFGKNSLADFKSSILYSSKILSTDIEQTAESKQISTVVSKLKKSYSDRKNILDYLKKPATLIKDVPIFSNYSRLAESLEYSLIKDYLICVDDIERKGNLLLKEILGLVDELRTKKRCKIILIFNEDALEKADKEDLKSYREKIIDHELKYMPTIVNNLNIVFSSSYPHISEVEKILTILNCNNIRLLKKIKSCYDDFKKIEDSIPQSNLTKFILPRITFLYWIKYVCTDDPKSKLINEKYKYGTFDFTSIEDNPERKTEDEIWAEEIIDELHIQKSPFDEYIDFYLENGFFEQEKLYNYMY
ncbi:MAG: hypothetical protein CENE_01012 [Candidatus Celerinatantimonas neptuna]|nr:MAG: hypothetical protein CENE_01012 [Candidatus Celerinatantimonas neptuna]